MIQTGSYNTLRVKRIGYDGIILTDGETEVVYPEDSQLAAVQAGDELFVFVYHDKEGRLVATSDRPLACVGDFACLEVVGETDKGAFIDIGIDKDVFVPKREQKRPMHRGEKHVVFLYLDERDERICASSWLEDYADHNVSDLEEGEEVSLLIADRSDLGYNAIINNKYIGLLYHNELYEALEMGEMRQGYVKKIRENQKVDLSLRPIGFDFILESKDVVLDVLRKNGGVLKLGDKSAPEDVRHQLKMSKKAFKQVIGGLYKQRLIEISDYEIKLLEEENQD